MAPEILQPRKPGAGAGAEGPNWTQIREDYGSTEMQIRLQPLMMLYTPGSHYPSLDLSAPLCTILTFIQQVFIKYLLCAAHIVPGAWDTLTK